MTKEDLATAYEDWFRLTFPGRLEAIENGRMLPPLEADDQHVQDAFMSGYSLAMVEIGEKIDKITDAMK